MTVVWLIWWFVVFVVLISFCRNHFARHELAAFADSIPALPRVAAIFMAHDTQIAWGPHRCPSQSCWVTCAQRRAESWQTRQHSWQGWQISPAFAVIGSVGSIGGASVTEHEQERQPWQAELLEVTHRRHARSSQNGYGIKNKLELYYYYYYYYIFIIILILFLLLLLLLLLLYCYYYYYYYYFY